MAVIPNRLADAMLGVETVLHLVPFQCSTSVCLLSGSLLLPEAPTAQTSLAETAVTPENPPLMVGLETTCQFVPFQCSMSVCAL